MSKSNTIFSEIKYRKKYQIDHLFSLAKEDLLNQVGWYPNQTNFFVTTGCVSLEITNALCHRFRLEGLFNTKVVYKWFPYPRYGLEIIVPDTAYGAKV
jgi:hypothetical protein